MAQYSRNWWYPDQAPVANQTARVFLEDQSTYAAIYSDAGLTVPMANPTTTNAAGHVSFFIANGTYWIFVGPEKTGDCEKFTLPDTSGPMSGYNEDIGDGVALVFVINHGLNNDNPTHSLKSNLLLSDETAEIVHTDANTLTVTFNSAPALNEFNIAVYG